MENQRIQQLVFGLFILLFFVSAPLVVLYTAGYRWNPQQGVVRTGTLFVASTPKDSTVRINGNPYKDKSPAIIKTLRPANYNIRLDLAGHIPWEKKLEVREGETTFVDNVILFLDTGPQIVLRENMKNVDWSSTGAHVAWADHQAGWTEIWISTIERPASRLVYRAELDEDIRLNWVERDVLEITQDDAMQYVADDGELLEREETTTVTFETNGDSVDILVNDDILARLPFGEYQVLDERGPYILVQDRLQDRISLLTTADADEPLLLQEDAVYVDWIREDALAFATEFAISIYEPSKHQTTLITRISERIHNVEWHPEGRYIFYATDTELRVIELDDRDGRRVTTLATMDQIYNFFAHPNGRWIYFVGNNGIDTGLYRRQLYKK